MFEPDHLDATCQTLAEAQDQDTGTATRAEAAKKRIADCDRRLANYRKMIDESGPTATVGAWIAEVEGEREAAERELGATIPKRSLTASEIKAVILSLKDHVRVLAEADPVTKAALYQELGIKMTYHSDRNVVAVEMEVGPSPLSQRRGRSGVRMSVSEKGPPRSPTGGCSPGTRRGPVKAGRRPPGGAALTGPGIEEGTLDRSRRCRLLGALSPAHNR